MILSILLFGKFQEAMSQKDWKEYFDLKYSSLCSSDTTIREQYLQKSLTGNAYDFMNLNSIVAPLMNMYVATRDEKYLNDEIIIINNIISTSEVSKRIPGNQYKYKDDYHGWISKEQDDSYNSEIVLLEGYIFRYIVQFLYEINITGWKDQSEQNQEWFNTTLDFVEKNIWEKWVTRSIRIKANPYGVFLSSRTHKASHWAHVAIFLKELTKKQNIKNECNDLINMFDLLLKRNLKSNPDFPSAYTWNSTWDDVTGTLAESSPNSVIQDVEHGNHVLAYIVAAKRYNNPNWTDEDMSKLCNTVKKVIFRRNTLSFLDNVDGTPSNNRPGWGNLNGEGWIQLALFDEETLNLFLDVALLNEPLIIQYVLEMRYSANLLLINHLKIH